MSHYDEQAKTAFKRGEYKKATGLLDRAIGRAPDIKLYDYRAACYEKLNDLPAALRDAKQGIKFAREDPTGYLRAGRILVKMSKDSQALEIYGYGLRHVEHRGALYELLRQTHTELQQELAPPKSADPMTVLPRELAEQILKFLSFKQLMNACLVSKQWAVFIRSAYRLWWHLDFTHTRKKVKNAFISKAINAGGASITKLTLNKLWDIDKALPQLIRTGTIQEVTLLETGLRIDRLAETLSRASDLKSLHIGSGTETTIKTISEITRLMSGTLESLRCDDLNSRTGALYVGIHPPLELPVLRVLELSWAKRWFGLIGLLSNIAYLPNLQRLRLCQRGNIVYQGPSVIDLSNHKALQHLDLRLNFGPNDFLFLPSSLKYLELYSHQPWNSTWIQRNFNCFLPVLEELHLDVVCMPASDYNYLLGGRVSVQSGSQSLPQQTGLSPLKALTMTHADASTIAMDTFTHARLAFLEHLSLDSCYGFGDPQATMIAQQLPKLQSLDLSRTNVTGAGISDIVKKGHLKRLVVHDCQYINPDAIAWARKMGVKVENSKQDAMAGGRKVRY